MNLINKLKGDIGFLKRPIIYILSIQYRFSIDTFYFGLKINVFECQHLLEYINYYLFYFTPEKINYKFSKNRFYNASFQDSEHGISIFLNPRKNCKNDFICFELTGRFFKDIVLSNNFIDFIIETFEERVNFQRLDIAIDCIYDDVENVPLDEKTHLLGFPFPSYSDNWRYQRIPFEMYGRLIDNSFYINMVYQGKNDVRLRVYDKNLDLMDKYDTTYSKYYNLNIKDSLVYRIELQMRSDKLKNYMFQYQFAGIEYNVFNIVSSFVNYIFSKYKFSNIDFVNKSFIRSFSTYVKRSPDLLKQIDFYRKRMFDFYNKYLDKYNEYYYFKDRQIISSNIKNSLKNEDFSNDIKKPSVSGIIEDDIGQFIWDFFEIQKGLKK